MILAMEKAPTGSRYLITGYNYHYKDLFRKIAGEFHVKRLYISLPDWLLRIAGKTGDLLARCGVASEVSTTNMSMLLAENFYNTDKACREIGFRIFSVNNESGQETLLTDVGSSRITNPAER